MALFSHFVPLKLQIEEAGDHLAFHVQLRLRLPIKLYSRLESSAIWGKMGVAKGNAPTK